MRAEYGLGPGGTQVPLFTGYASVGSATSVSAWRVIKITYDANDNPTATLFPRLSPASAFTDEFIFVWDNRGTYTYG